ncbi:transcription elongation factor GreB [Ignatzschineria ureiclastica]|uniref:Transcription elongation factor GreB n=1 Tax=Ignatzschineria ureiclastica TaxID=472582 RepID=A0A2U2AE85_9GAMM|nr:transcription elongation factor GreB [Ignatzschineria ureiclastica]PWD80974.1 transcription elongation factor GreB [Ignatzschineria ureiclastica]GGZ93512.1 transcription elongation factor GreB [Ignatzschineria ureiclastica]
MSVNLITPEGLALLQKELDFLWRIERPEITQKVTWAAGLGDRSENADYQFNKQKLRAIDRRVRHLRKRLELLRPVPYSPSQEGKIYFGAWVRLSDEEENSLYFRIVGADEIAHHKDYASINSPIAKACLGKEVDDEVIVRTELLEKQWFIDEIHYGVPDEIRAELEAPLQSSEAQ